MTAFWRPPRFSTPLGPFDLRHGQIVPARPSHQPGPARSWLDHLKDFIHETVFIEKHRRRPPDLDLIPAAFHRKSRWRTAKQPCSRGNRGGLHVELKRQNRPNPPWKRRPARARPPPRSRSAAAAFLGLARGCTARHCS